MKIALFVLFSLFFVSSVFAQTCINARCVAAGGNCTQIDNYDQPTCQKGYYCSNAVCTKEIALGSACNETLGQQCAGSEDDNAMCYKGTCQAVTRNLVAGGNCSVPVTQCSRSYYCDFVTSVCTEFPAKGDNCTTAGKCAAGLTCNLGLCITQYSIAAGAACTYGMDSQSVSMSCAAGLFCKSNGTLHSGICTAGFPSSNAACNLTTACTNTEETCICDKCTAPITVTASQASTLIKLDQCIAHTNCDPANPEDCCKEYQCTAYHVILQSPLASIFEKAFESCGYPGFKYCDSLLGRMSTAEKVGIVIGVIVGIVIIAGLVIFCVRRRKHHYHQLH